MKDMSWFRKFKKKTGLNPQTPDPDVNSVTITNTIPSSIFSDVSDISESYSITSMGTGISSVGSITVAGGGAGGAGGYTSGTIYMGSAVAPAAVPPIYTSIPGGAYAGTFTIPSVTFTSPPPSSIITLSASGGKEIVKIKADGTVEWADGYQIDEAAEALGKSLGLAAELAAGITKKVKLSMRDSVFEDLISIAKEKGSLTAEDLTYLLQASKIVEKLKGSKE